MKSKKGIMLMLAMFTLTAAMFVPTPASADDEPPAEVSLERVKAIFDGSIPGNVGEWAEEYGWVLDFTNEELSLAAFNLGDGGVTGEAFLAALDARSDVTWANYDAVARSQFTPNDPKWPQQYGPRLIKADLAWDYTRGSSSVMIAILDTGVDQLHEDLVNPCTPYCSTGGYDVYGHGTHVAGIAAAQMNNGKGIAGIAQNKIHSCKALTDAGAGWWSVLAVCIVEASLTSNVISMSLGGNCNWNGVLLCPEVQKAIEIAWSRNRVIVAASGNDGRDGYISHPAAFPNVIAVGSIGSTSVRSWFSNGGPQLDLMAPGESVISTVPATSIMCGVRLDPYCSVSGTSMSTPHVAGVAGLVFSRCPSWTNAQVVNRLFSTADNLGPIGWDQAHGHGRVDAYDAVRLGC